MPTCRNSNWRTRKTRRANSPWISKVPVSTPPVSRNSLRSWSVWWCKTTKKNNITIINTIGPMGRPSMPSRTKVINCLSGVFLTKNNVRRTSHPSAGTLVTTTSSPWVWVVMTSSANVWGWSASTPSRTPLIRNIPSPLKVAWWVWTSIPRRLPYWPWVSMMVQCSSTISVTSTNVPSTSPMSEPRSTRIRSGKFIGTLTPLRSSTFTRFLRMVVWWTGT